MTGRIVRFDGDFGRFNMRIAGMALRNGRVLLQRALSERYWVLPGGHVEIGEDSEATLVREIREELDVEADVSRLLYIVENFFTLNGRSHHEVSFIYEMFLPETFPFAEGVVVQRNNEGLDVEFAWHPTEREWLQQLPVLPAFLVEDMAKLPDRPQRRVWRG